MRFQAMILGWVLLTAVSASAGDTLLMPGDVVTMAADMSLASQLAASDSLAAAADVRHARATLYPTLGFQGQYTARDNQPEIAAGPVRFAIGNQSNGEYLLTARELLWNGGQRGLAIEAARQNLDAVRAQGRSRIQSTQLAALDRYVTAMNLKGQDVVLAATLASLEKRLREVQDMFDQGLVARNDLLEIRAQRDRIRDDRSAVHDRLTVVLQDLNRILGREPTAQVSLPDTLVLAIRSTVPDTLGSGYPLEDNLQVRAATANAQTARTLAGLAHKAWYPNVFVAASHSWQENDALVHPYVNAVALGVSWDIFDGGARAAQSAKAAAGVLAFDRSRTEAERSARITREQARLDQARARREEATARSNVAAAAENLRIVGDQYREGVARAGDVLDAEALLADSRLQVILKHHQDFLAGARMAAAEGRDLVAYFRNPNAPHKGASRHE